jgi:cytoskeletal protein CcmA (bactofilin family)
VHLAEPPTQNSGLGGTAVIGEGMTIKGSIHSRQDLFMDGELDGVLIVENCALTIGPHGKVVANARAREVDIQGAVTGNVECTGKTFIRASGRLVGDIRAAGIVIEDGAGFKGKVEIVNLTNPAESADDK